MQVSGNLNCPIDDNGLGNNYQNFFDTVIKVKAYYTQFFGTEIMNSIKLFVDNATENSGYTPIITPILGKYLTIKLGITPHCRKAKIVHQFAHELMHYVFYVIYGLDKPHADTHEESICSAAALIVLYDLYRNDFTEYNDHIKSLKSRNDGLFDAYAEGSIIAENTGYKFEKLIELIRK